MFRGIERVWQGDLESLGLVRLPDTLASNRDVSVFHPALLDACLQTVIAADRDFCQRNGGLYLPHEIESVRLFREPSARVWAHARLLEKTPRRSLSEVDVYNEDGRLAARVRGLRSHRVAGGKEEVLDDLLYSYQWHQETPSRPDRPPSPATWLIFADDRGVGAKLRDRLLARGDASSVVQVKVGSHFTKCGERDYRINPGRPDDVLRLLKALVAANERRAAALSIFGTWTRHLLLDSGRNRCATHKRLDSRALCGSFKPGTASPPTNLLGFSW